MQSSNPGYKPSPLSFGQQRASPFRRPSTPNSPPSGRPGTPGSSPSRGYTPIQSPSKLNQSYTVEDGETVSPRSPRADPIPQPKFTRELPPSPTKGAQGPGSSSPILGSRPRGLSGANTVQTDAAVKLPPNQVREIREAFQVLDRDNDGLVNKDDVADVLQNIGKLVLLFPQWPRQCHHYFDTYSRAGQDSSPSTLSCFFPPGSSQTMNFPTFLNTLSQLMAAMSSSQELINALAAFDDEDNGQVDVAELRDALLHTTPEDGGAPLTEEQIDEVFSGFVGRRTFGGRGAKGAGGGMGKRGEVFQYQDFVRSVVGTENGNNGRRETGAAKS
ncbi:Calcium-binding EF-hand [Penicillium argentinense]|uniref:Calcium-binding EF-hand n=1 Tax=Penicillium argentinense TaxID=1131581 RepID=A0A9W9EQN9_9EURO|nr:Calcium-binding EF-hand [Penicillium argentinense]KAJ5086134.1 Calcium-binding EF-hand [Penicillium argentinense]